jgi:hypothetical protein
LDVYQFFHENHQFFEIFEITGFDGSLILIFFPQRTATGGSVIRTEMS